MNARPRFVIAAVLSILVIVVAMIWFWPAGRGPITVVGASRLGDSGRVALRIRNDAPDQVRLYAIRLWTRVGTNWALAGTTHLDYTNCTASWVNIDVDFPARPRPWKASLVYMPAFSHLNLLKYRLKDAWNAKSLRQGFMTTGWEGARYADSPEIP